MHVTRSRLTALLRLLLSTAIALALAIGLQAAPSEAASKASKVKALISKVIKSKHPKKTYKSLSKANRVLIKKELKHGTVKLRWHNTSSTLASPASAMPNGSQSVYCWSKTLEASFMGGITRRALFSTTNTTLVCVSSGRVTSVTVPQRYQDTFELGWHPDGVSAETLNVSWEGRGAVRGEFSWGAGGWTLLQRTWCAQIRLNSDLSHYKASDNCRLYA